jgi:hypothetical protein
MLARNKYLFDGLEPRRYKVPVAKLDPNMEGVQHHFCSLQVRHLRVL